MENPAWGNAGGTSPASRNTRIRMGGKKNQAAEDGFSTRVHPRDFLETSILKKGLKWY